MAWTAPRTWTTGETVTASIMNSAVRDNLLETAPAKAATAGGVFVATGANAIAERIPTGDFVATSETRANTAYGALATAGPAVTVTTGTQAIIAVTALASNASANHSTWMSFAISGATTQAANDNWAFNTNSLASAADGIRATAVTLYSSGTHGALTAGSNTFTAEYRTSGGAATGTWSDRGLWVFPL